MAQMLISWLGPFRYVWHYSYNVAMWCQWGLPFGIHISGWIASVTHWMAGFSQAELSWNANDFFGRFGFVKQLGCAKLVVMKTIFTSLDVINCNHMCQGQNASCTLARRSCPDVRILLCRCFGFPNSWWHDHNFPVWLYDCMLPGFIPTTSYAHLKAHNLP